MMNDGKKQSECTSGVAGTTELLISLNPLSVQLFYLLSVCSMAQWFSTSLPVSLSIHRMIPFKTRLSALEDGLWRIAEHPEGMIFARFASDANGREGHGISRGC